MFRVSLHLILLHPLHARKTDRIGNNSHNILILTLILIVAGMITLVLTLRIQGMLGLLYFWTYDG